MNKLTIIGNLTRDPELRTVGSGITVCSFTVAVNRRRSNQNGNQPEADFFRVTAWRQLGEICSKYLAKGRKVCVVGELQNRSYEAKDGTKRTVTEIVADDIEFLTPRSQEGSGGGYGQSAPSYERSAPAAPEGFTEIDDDELPF